MLNKHACLNEALNLSHSITRISAVKSLLKMEEEKRNVQSYHIICDKSVLIETKITRLKWFHMVPTYNEIINFCLYICTYFLPREERYSQFVWVTFEWISWQHRFEEHVLAKSEQAALTNLSAKVAWLSGYSWRHRTERFWVWNPHMLPPLVSQGNVVVPCKPELGLATLDQGEGPFVAKLWVYLCANKQIRNLS